MNMIKLRGLLSCIFLVTLLTSIIVSMSDDEIKPFIQLMSGEDYFYFDPKQIPVLLLLPVMILLDIFYFFLIFPFTTKIAKIMSEKLIIPSVIYAFLSLITGFIISLVVSIYPLGTHYYKCDSTSIVSSGSYYARTKEMCEQRSYSIADEGSSHSAPEPSKSISLSNTGK